MTLDIFGRLSGNIIATWTQVLEMKIHQNKNLEQFSFSKSKIIQKKFKNVIIAITKVAHYMDLLTTSS